MTPDQIRANFPGCAAIVDGLRSAFGPGVRAKCFREEGKTMGNPQPFDGTDADQIIRLSDMDAARNRKANRA